MESRTGAKPAERGVAARKRFGYHRKVRMRRTALIAALTALAACGDPTGAGEVWKSCVAPVHQLVMLKGVLYAASYTLSPTFQPGAPYGTVQKLQGCEDVIVVDENGAYDPPDNTIDDGDSNYLPRGTVLYVIPGTDADDGLAVRPHSGAWEAVQRLDRSDNLVGYRYGELLLLTQHVVPAATMDALFQGPVSADSRGCLRLETTGDYGVTAVWPYGYILGAEGGDPVIRDRNGAIVGELDGTFRLGGGEVEELPSVLGFTDADRALAADRCPGRFWLVSEPT